jgi:transcriptional regulator with XRE-family HTH domain
MKSMIRHYRRQKGMTQQDLAEVIGRSRSIVAEYELGTTRVPQPILWKIAKCLEVPVDLLFEEEIAPNGQEPVHA